jgi:serine/threonine protein kinase
MSDVVTGRGTHCYIAPEFLLEGKIGATSDIWALGITMIYVVHVYVAAINSIHVALSLLSKDWWALDWRRSRSYV